jgi:LUD domain
MTIEAAIEPLPVDESFAVPATEEQLRRAAKGLTERGYTTHLVDTVEHARALVRQLLPRDRAVLTAASETLRLSGILADVDESGEFRSVRAELAGVDPTDVRAQIRMGAAPDVVVGSVHAVTEDGVLVAASASGSQLGPYAAGAERVIWVVGAQKVVPDLDTALRRVRSYSLPLEHARWRAKGFESFIGKLLILEREYVVDRATVVLVREEVGF